MAPGLDAARAVTIFANGSTRPSTRTSQLTVADHGYVLAVLCDAFSAVAGNAGVLPCAAALAGAHAPFPLDYHGYAARDIHARIDEANRQANGADIPAASTVVRTHVRALDAAGHPHAQATPTRNMYLTRARAAAQGIWALAAVIRPDGSMTDLDWALRSGCDILHALRMACKGQAKLLDVAYHAARTTRPAPPTAQTLTAAAAAETLTAAAAALGTACGILMCAQEAAQVEAHRLQMAS